MNQMDVLEYLKEHGQATAQEIASDNADCNKFNLYRKLKQLEKCGCIVRIERFDHDIIWRAIQ